MIWRGCAIFLNWPIFLNRKIALFHRSLHFHHVLKLSIFLKSLARPLAMLHTQEAMTKDSKLRVLKGAEMFCALNGVGPGRYVQIRKGSIVTVLSVTDKGADGCAVRLMLRDGVDMLTITLFASSAKKLDRPEFNLNTGDPTRFLRLGV